MKKGSPTPPPKKAVTMACFYGFCQCEEHLEYRIQTYHRKVAGIRFRKEMLYN